MEGFRAIRHCWNCSNNERFQSTAGVLNRAIEIRSAELDVEVEGRGARSHRPGGGDVGLGVGPHGASADEACADEDDEGGAHPEADHRGHQIQPGPQHLAAPPPRPPESARARGAGGERALSRLPEQAAAYKSGAGGLELRVHRRGVWDLGFAWAAGKE